jgi:hypothetical protein
MAGKIVEAAPGDNKDEAVLLAHLDADLASLPREDGCLVRVPAGMVPEQISVENKGPFDATLGRCYRVRSQDANQVVTPTAGSSALSHGAEGRAS